MLPQEDTARSIPGRCRAHKGAFSPPEILDGRSPDRTRHLNVCPRSAPLPTLGSTVHSGFILSSSPERRSVQQSRLLQAQALGKTLAGGLLISSLFLKTIPGLPPLLPLSVPNQTDTHPSSPLPSLLSSSISNQALSYKSFGGGTLEEAAGGKNYSTTNASHEDTR